MRAPEHARVAVHVIPRARINAVDGERGGAFVMRVTAPPDGGRANDAACRVIAERAGVGVRSVSVVQGPRSRNKVIQVEPISTVELVSSLRAPAR